MYAAARNCSYKVPKLLLSTEVRRSEYTTPRSDSMIFGSKLKSRMRSASMSIINGSALGGKPVGVDRVVLRGVGVVVAAVLFHLDVELLGSVLLRAVEHHVFEKVRNAGDAGPLVARSDLVEEIHRDVGNIVILLNEDLHPVGKGFGFNVRGLGYGQDGRRENDHQHAHAPTIAERLPGKRWRERLPR